MLALVVYESFFGCTEQLAWTIADRLQQEAGFVAEALPVQRAPARLTGLDLVVVGAPTHLRGLSSVASRWLQAQTWGAPEGRRRPRRPYGRPLQTASVRAWLAGLPPAGAQLAAAAFDTRSGDRRRHGGAGPLIAERLQAAGGRLVLPPASFRVQSITGPLAPTERERADRWASALARAVTPAA